MCLGDHFTKFDILIFYKQYIFSLIKGLSHPVSSAPMVFPLLHHHRTFISTARCEYSFPCDVAVFQITPDP